MSTRSKAVQGTNQTCEGLESPGFSHGENVNRLYADNERLKNELFEAQIKVGEWRMKAKTESMRVEALARTVMSDMGNQREPLTALQIDAIVSEVYRNCGHMQPTPEIIVRAVERAHGITYIDV